jgi:ABC-type branched-subunit amino acid transport system ATPase component
MKETNQMSILPVEQYVDFARCLADYVYVRKKGAMVLAEKIQKLSEADVKRYWCSGSESNTSPVSRCNSVSQ